MISLFALANCIVIYLQAHRVLVVVFACKVVEALFVELFGWKHTFVGEGEKSLSETGGKERERERERDGDST